MGNIVNRVFDSSGPEGKVRGTPQQIIEKYLALARDAQLGNDRVAAENFLQHAEHYARMLGEAQRELEAQRGSFGGGQGGDERGEERQGDGQPRGERQGEGQPRGDRREDGQSRREERGDRNERREERAERPERREERRAPVPADVIEFGQDDGPALVETPEMRATAAEPAEAEPAEAEAAPAARAPRRPRRPRQPAAERPEAAE